ncbi:MAG: acyl-CoA dehydrogenase family protein [Chloroflexota bacterium]
MDFEIDEELKMVQSLARDFVSEQLKPLERDLLGRAANLSDARIYLPPETEAKLVKMANELGLWGIGIPEELGGVGFSTLGNCLIAEELAQTVIPFNFGDVTPILFDCNDQQRESYFLPALNRQKQAYLALMEPGKAVELTRMGLKAQKENGHYILNGQKVSFSRPGDDYFAVVFAATGEKEGRDSLTGFLVDADTPGFRVSGDGEPTGWRTQVREPMLLVFDNCQVPAANILGEEGQALHLGKKWLPSRRVVRAARSVGVASRLLEEATTQAQSFESFGQLAHKRSSIEAALADIATAIHACRLMVYEAAWKADEGRPIRREAAMVKLMATEMVHSVASSVAHIYNGPPYVAGLPMERLCRHALATSATELALEAQRKIIARDILKGLKI